MEGKKVTHKNSSKNIKKKRLMQKGTSKVIVAKKMEIINIFGRSVESNNYLEIIKREYHYFRINLKK